MTDAMTISPNILADLNRPRPVETVYMTCAESAKLLRQHLKRAFPGVAFSVKSKTYSGGASITVSWTDGPTSADVQPILSTYSGSDFDGMIDLAVCRRHWLMPDGTVEFAETSGTGVSIPAEKHPMPHHDAKLVRFGSDYVFGQRQVSKALLESAMEQVCKLYDREPLPIVESNFGAYVKCDGQRLCDWHGDTLADLIRRKASEMTGA